MDHHTGVVSGGRFLRLWFHILLNGRKPCCWYNNSFLLFSRTLALFAGEMSHIASPLAVVSGVCLLPAGSMSACSCIASLAHPCKGSTVVLLLLAVQVCSVFVGKVYATCHLCCLRNREMSHCLCSVLTLGTAFAVLSLVKGRKRAFL